MIVPFELGKEFDFYGVDNCRFKLDGTVYEALEDAYDGYRSALGSVEVAQDPSDIFQKQPLDRVRVVEFTTPDTFHQSDGYNDFEGYVVESVKDGHRWLVFGTDDISAYYPGFVFHYTPRSRPERSEE